MMNEATTFANTAPATASPVVGPSTVKIIDCARSESASALATENTAPSRASGTKLVMSLVT